MTPKKKIAIYCRSSRIKSGNTLLLGIESQKSAALKYLKGEEALEIEFFIDKNISGKKKNRPALDRLRSQLAKGEISIVIVSDISRIARSLQNLLELESEIRSTGASFVSVKESIDTSSPTGKLIFQIMGAIGEFGSSIAREKSLQIVEECRKKGIQLGRRRLSVSNLKLEEINGLRKKGHSYKGVGEILAMPTMTVYRILQREKESA